MCATHISVFAGVIAEVVAGVIVDVQADFFAETTSVYIAVFNDGHFDIPTSGVFTSVDGVELLADDFFTGLELWLSVHT